MTELSDRLNGLAEDLTRGVELAGPGRRRRARRQSRRRAALSITIVALAVVTVIALLVTQNGHTSVQVTTQPSATPGVGAEAPVTLPTVSHPTGWVALDFGRARLWAPKGWQVFGPNVCPHGGREILYGPAEICHGPEATEPYLLIEPLSREIVSGRAFKLNGLRVFQETAPVGALVSWAAPSLGVVIQAYGAGAESIARTLGPSSLVAITRAPRTVAIPAAWKAVTYDGLSARVPASWSAGGLACSGIFNGPSVLRGTDVGSPGCGQSDDNGAFTPTDGLWLEGDRSLRLADPRDVVERLTVDGHPADLISDPGQGAAISIDIALPGRHLYAIIGLGVDPKIAEEVLTSLRTAN